MDLKDLETFIKLARYSSFSEAAERMHIAQSALSRRVSRLEHRLGIQLLVRHARGSELTREGEVLAEKGKAIFDQFEQLQQQLRKMTKEPAGTVRLGLTPIAAQFLGPKIVSVMSLRHPLVDVVLREGQSDQVFDWLKAGELDIGCLYSEYTYEDFDAAVLLREPLYLVGAPQRMREAGIAEDEVIPIERLRTLPIIIPDDRSLSRIVNHVYAERNADTIALTSAPGTNSAKGMLTAGRGFCLLPYPTVHNEVARGQLVMARTDPQVYWYMQMATPLNQVPWPGVQAMREAITEEVSTLLKTGLWRGSLV
jgi:LysR family nitrogen assimilation transcriptional regulator